jgi:hypothetical protein
VQVAELQQQRKQQLQAQQQVQHFVIGPDGLDDEDRTFLEQYRNGLDTTGRAQVEGTLSSHGCCRLIPIPEIKHAPKARARVNLLVSASVLLISIRSLLRTSFKAKQTQPVQEADALTLTSNSRGRRLEMRHQVNVDQQKTPCC